MKKEKYIAPKLDEEGFNCPNPECGFFAHQNWDDLYSVHRAVIEDLKYAKCSKCKMVSVWKGDKMIYPDSTGIPSPNEDMDEDIKKDYLEAANILQKSPKASAALLRLAIQKLCIQVGEKGKNLNQDIKKLVSKGLPREIQQALDIVRVIGNNSVHPGEINIEDNTEVAIRLFELLNFIAYAMITQPKDISELYQSLPDDKKEAIVARDVKE